MRSVRSAQGPTVDGDSPSGSGVHLQDASDEEMMLARQQLLEDVSRVLDGKVPISYRNPLNVIAENMAVDTNETVHRILQLLGQEIVYEGPNPYDMLLYSGSENLTSIRAEVHTFSDGAIEVSLYQGYRLIWRTHLTRRR